MTITNEEKKYWELKKNIRIMNSQKRDVEKINLIDKGKIKDINEVIKSNKITNNSLKPLKV